VVAANVAAELAPDDSNFFEIKVQVDRARQVAESRSRECRRRLMPHRHAN
jgi:hypothetical protein